MVGRTAKKKDMMGATILLANTICFFRNGQDSENKKTKTVLRNFAALLQDFYCQMLCNKAITGFSRHGALLLPVFGRFAPRGGLQA